MKLKITLNHLRVLHMLGILFLSCSLFSQTTENIAQKEKKEIPGIISDNTGQPIIGANIVIKGTGIGVVTDIDGKFSLTTSVGSILQISYLGFETQEVAIKNQRRLNITLIEDQKMLDEVIVIGYGATSKRMLTSAISKVDGENLESKAINTIGDGLKGKVAGVRIFTSDNQPGAEATFRIRGGSSITQTNSPLVLVDGVERDMAGVNPNDIESIQVLKDAASTSIYGARGSNGVVMITTRSGTANKGATIRFEASVAHQDKALSYDLMNAEDFIYTMRKAVAVGAMPASNFGATAAGSGNGDNSIFSTRYLKPGEQIPAGYKSMKDPLDPSKILIFTDNSVYDRLFEPTWWQNYYLQATGGSDHINYNFSLGYLDDDGIGKSTSYDRFTAHGDMKFKINKFISVRSTFDFSEMNMVDLPSNKRTFLQRTLAIPNTQKIYWDNGLPTHGTNSTTLPPDWYAYYYSRDRKVNRYTVAAELTWQLTDDLKAIAKGSNFDRYNRYDGFVKETNYGDARTASADISHFNRRNFQAYANYVKKIKEQHYLNFMLGTEIYQNRTNSLGASASGGASDLIPTLTAQPNKDQATSGIIEESSLSYFSRLMYSLKDKYILTASLRADASSKFSKENRWGYFPTGSAAWIISEENFMKEINAISNLKLRTSYGQTGNNAIGLFDSTGSYDVSGKYNNQSAIYASVMGNKALKWETTTQFDVGLEGSFLNNRISFDLDWYNKVTSDLITRVTLPNTSGFNDVLINAGKVRFYGFDFALHTQNIKTKDFTWTSDFTYSYNKNKIIKLADNGLPKNRMNGTAVSDGTFFGGYAEGESLGAIYGYKVKGIVETQEQADNAYYDTGSKGFRFSDGLSITGRKNIGDYEWVNREGSGLRPDGSIQIDAEDQFLLGNTIPHSTGGIGNTFKYKNLSLYVYLDYQIGSSIVNTQYQRFFMGTFGYSYNLHKDVKKAWEQPGDNTKFARFFANDPDQGNGNYSRVSDIFTQKADYLCIRDITLSYDFPKKWLTKLYIKDLNVYMTCSNLYYFTEVEGVSPENTVTDNAATSYSPYPPTRKISLGVKVTF